MADKKYDKNISKSEQDHNGIAERSITGDDLKRYKNALDNTRSYVSGDKEWPSSSHQFSKESESK